MVCGREELLAASADPSRSGYRYAWARSMFSRMTLIATAGSGCSRAVSMSTHSARHEPVPLR
jgi:hypothetical protein